MGFSQQVKLVWIVAAPLLFSPMLYFGMPFRCVYCIVLISSFWIMEVVPIGISSLLPIFLFPVLGISSAKDICLVYFKDSIVLFICTLVMAMAAQETNLHRRIALAMLCKVGTRKQTMLLGFMATTALLSFFISDTACTAMMIPIALAVVGSINKATEATEHVEGKVEGSKVESVELEQLSSRQRGFCKVISLIGGTAIVTGTGPNIVFREIIQTTYSEDEVSVSYIQWMAFAMPSTLLCLLSSFVVITCCFMGPQHLLLWCSRETEDEEQIAQAVEKKIKAAYDSLGNFTFAEKSILGWFAVLVACWILRKPGFIKGWGNLFPNDGNLLTDSVPGVLIVFILFAWPRNLSSKDFSPILNWSTMKTRFSWSCVLLIGAGYAISEGVEKSGLSSLISSALKDIFGRLHSVFLLYAVTAFITFTTEFASNVSTGSIFIPIVLNIAESLHLHPLYLALPVTVACSFAFMLPMATPANAVVYDTKIVSMIEMILAGILLNICCISITVLNMSTWTYWLFDLGTFPSITRHHNSTFRH